MFTGIIESVQPVHSITESNGCQSIGIPLGEDIKDIQEGDSIAVNGVCLTVSALSHGIARFDVIQETLAVTTLGQWKEGQHVNLERALSVNGRFGGHVVQGHVDGTATVKHINKDPGKHIITVTAESALMRFMIPRGSVAVDGVSLTITEVKDDMFSFSLIPTTLEKTNLTALLVGSQINVEADLISKWINHRLDQTIGQERASSITLEKLQKQGFIE